jgi:hypothetical protein
MTILQSKIRRQISYCPFGREPKASAAQLDYLAALLARGIEAQAIRWDHNQQEAFSVRRASMMISSIERTLGVSRSA